MNNLYSKRNIIAIDLKSFFAACECLERGYDMYTTPLAVCDPKRKGAITLAVTPYLKSLGVGGRTRIYEIPSHINFIKVPPKMSLYIKKNREVLSVYLEFVANEDMLVYSIDEVFLDVTHYLSLYKKTAYELAMDILKDIKKKTGLVGTAGIGPNILLAKLAMDLEAKKTASNIAEWTYDDIQQKLWPIKPLSKMWGIGYRMEKKLNSLGLNTIGDIARFDINILKDKFGSLGVDLWNHTHGIDFSIISELKTESKDQSISHSQVLYKDYNDNNVFIIVSEMIDHLAKRLRSIKKQCSVIGFGISYSKNIGGGFYHQSKLDAPTKNSDEILKICRIIFDKFYDDSPIRKVSINLGSLTEDNFVQLNLFETIEDIKDNNSTNETIDLIKNKFGANSILKASNLLPDSTAIVRNKKIGGHNE